MRSSFDVIVVGAGTAGVPAALAAAKRGLAVALVEAADDIGGTLHLSTASISGAGTAIQAESGVEDDADRHFADYLRINHGTGDHALVRRWIDDAADTIAWLQSIGWSCSPPQPVFALEHDLYDTPRTYRSTGLGLGVIDAYRGALDAAREVHDIDLMLRTRFTGFITESSGVTGIRVEHDGEETAISGRAVIVTTGGFSSSSRHWTDFHGLAPLRYGIPTAQGDAIDAARMIGGDIWFTDHVLPNFGAVRDIGGPPSAWIHSKMLPTLRPPWEIYVNLDGERFMAEDGTHIFARELAVRGQRDWGFWVVYDDAIRETAPPLLNFDAAKVEEKFAGADEDYLRADSIIALAQQMGVPEAALERSIRFFNAGQSVGSDMLGRLHMPLPIARGPFYAIRHYGYAISSYPGLRVDEDLHVLRADGTAIAGLYAAGEAIGIGFLGLGFMSGSIVSSAISFGRRAGREVLA